MNSDTLSTPYSSVNLVPFHASFIALFIAFLTAAILAYPILKMLAAMKSRQTVSQHAPETHQVKQGTPTMGGIIILVGAIAGMASSLHSPFEVACLVGLVLFGLIGFVDDFVVPRMTGKRGLGWIPKIVLETAAAAGVLTIWPGTSSGLLFGVGIFMLLFLSNAYNFSDGIDGLAGGLAILLCFGFTMLSPHVSAVPLYAIAGAAIVFLFINAPPAKVFMGDVGSLGIGAVFGLASLGVLTLGGTGIVLNETVPLLILLGVMLAEIIPPPTQIFWVKVFKKRLFPYTPIHHAFERAGWPETRVTASFLLVQLLLVFAAFYTKFALIPTPRYHYYYIR